MKIELINAEYIKGYKAENSVGASYSNESVTFKQYNLYEINSDIRTNLSGQTQS